MHFSSALALLPAASAQVLQGFNYGSTYSDGSFISLSGYQALFNAAKQLQGTSGAFTSARLFTSIQGGTTSNPTDAFQAAIDTGTSLLLGLWASGGEATIQNELSAIQAAITAHGSQFTGIVEGISVGSEDLYRISPIGIENESGIGAGPDEVAGYIDQVKQVLGSGPLANKPVGHVDTWTAWVNASNSRVIESSEFIGMDAYPYFQNTQSNGIADGFQLFTSAYEQTQDAVGGKEIWVTETGWPVSGETENLAVPSTENAKTYWDQVGCGKLFGKVKTFWFTLQDAFPTTPNPSFGVVGRGSSANDVPTQGLFDLSCSGAASDAPSSSGPAVSAVAAPSAQAAGNNGAQRENAVEQGNTSGQKQEQTGGSAKGGAAEDKPQASPESTPPPQQPPSKEHEQSPPNVAPTTLITKTTALPSASASPSGCPASLSGDFEYPHLIVPVSKAEPNTAYGTSYNGTVSPSISSIFNFDYPAGSEGKTCTLVFLLPQKSELETSSFALSGSGGLDFERLAEPATEETTYAHQPAVDQSVGSVASVEPGNEYVITSTPCAAGQRKAYKLSAIGSLDLNYFQDYNPSPIGLFVTVC